MERINIKQNGGAIKFDAEVVENGVQTVGAALEGVASDTRSIILVAALVDNLETMAKQSPEYLAAAAEAKAAGEDREPLWGGGQLGINCGNYRVEATIKLDHARIMRELIGAALETGDDPLEAIKSLIGEPAEDCDCPSCRRARGEFEVPKPDVKH